MSSQPGSAPEPLTPPRPVRVILPDGTEQFGLAIREDVVELGPVAAAMLEPRDVITIDNEPRQVLRVATTFRSMAETDIPGGVGAELYARVTHGRPPARVNLYRVPPEALPLRVMVPVLLGAGRMTLVVPAAEAQSVAAVLESADSARRVSGFGPILTAWKLTRAAAAFTALEADHQVRAVESFLAALADCSVFPE